MSDAMVQFSDGRVTWSPGLCSCGRTTWTVDRGRDAQEVTAATCECGERRSLRLKTPPAPPKSYVVDYSISVNAPEPEPPKPVEPEPPTYVKYGLQVRLPAIPQDNWPEIEPLNWKPLSETCESVAATARAFDKLAASTAPVINALDGLSRAFLALRPEPGKCRTCGGPLGEFVLLDCHGEQFCSEECEAAADQAETRAHLAALPDSEVLDWAERATEFHDHRPGPPDLAGRAAARAEMQARWDARAALPPMLDDFDNLPDAEPAGIVRRP